MWWLRDIHSYNRSQKRALLFLWLLALLIIFFDYVYQKKLEESAIQPTLDTTATIAITKKFPVEDKIIPSVSLRAFNPNTDPLDTLLAKGVPSRIANGIVKLRDYGKIFTGPDDLRILYGMNDSLLNILLPYAVFPNTPKQKDSRSIEEQSIKISGVFDPNYATMEQMVEIGVPKNVAKAIRRYVERRGKFKTPEDLKKIYNLDSATFTQILPYVRTEPIEPIEIPLAQAELNTANFSDLKKVLNTNNEHISKILNYRRKLGGFFIHQQLYEIEGLPEDLILLAKEKCWIDTIQIDKIDLNKADFATILRHPYFEKTDVEKIIRYRNFAKTITSLQELVKNKVISKELAAKIAPYIKFN